MKLEIDLSQEYLAIIKKILSTHLPAGSKVWLFGSRATGRAKRFSDIDLLVDIGAPLSLQLLSRLNSAFDESVLPYKVDLADAATINHEFMRKIEPQLIALDFI